MRAPSASSPRRCRSTGRVPIAQPPGIDTSARPRFASNGPSTQMPARIVLTMSYGASTLSLVDGADDSVPSPSRWRSSPSSRSSVSMLRMSDRSGTFRSVTGVSPEASSAAAISGSAAFFAP